ncbi:MAG: Ig-like domain-containing protein [Spirosomataceae bacterium]
MKRSLHFVLWGCLLVLLTGQSSIAQLSSFRVNYQVTYSVTNNQYSVWVVPQYNVPNANNTGTVERGATAQVSLKVPTSFTISNIVDVRGIWDKQPLKLGPNQQTQFQGEGLPLENAYYVIGKSPSETEYGVFSSGVPVELFRFSSNACVGFVEILDTQDPFVEVADRVFALNTAPSFYSRSGQPTGGNQIPLEQYNGPIGFGASCLQANPDTFSATPGSTSQQTVLANDSFNGGTPDPMDIIVTLVTGPSQGTAVYNPFTGNFSYTGNPGFVGTDTYRYRICDLLNPSVCSEATVTVNLTCPTFALPASPAPVNYCVGDVATPLNLVVGTGFQAVWYTSLTGGTGSLTAPTPSTTSAGSTVFYVGIRQTTSGCESVERIQVVVNVTNCREIFAFNDNNITPQNTPVTGRVLTNDDLNTGISSLVVSNTLVSLPTNGAVVMNANGVYTYTPATNFTGVDRFRYRVCDSGTPAVCDTAMVQIVIYSTPSLTNNNPPIALDDASTTGFNQPVSGFVIRNDRDPDPAQTLSVTLVSGPTRGNVVLLPSGQYTYTPNTGFVGEDTFVYRVCDNGSPSLCDEATVEIEVKAQPTNLDHLPPVAADDYAITTNDTPISGSLLINDVDPEGTTLTVNTTPIVNASSGTVQINANGTFTYTPVAGFVGSTQFVYQVCDAGSPIKCAQATVYVQVTAGQLAVLPKVYLQGALFGVNLPNTLMRDNLRTLGLLPLTSPYPTLGWSEITTTGTVSPGVFQVEGANAIVDWVYVELRDATDPSMVVDSRSALLQRDGDVVGLDGVNPVRFSTQTPARYFVSVKHRNHLGVMTQSAIELSSAVATVDFRQATTPTFTLNNLIVSQAQVVVEQGRAMWAGNVLRDGRIIYQGTSNDVNGIYQDIINSNGNFFGSAFFKLKTYNSGDVNLNGEAVFQGTGNDVEFIYQNVIANHPGNVLGQNFFVIREQLP